MIDIPQFRALVISPALTRMQLPKPDAAEELLLGTALQESRLTFLKQIGGPALGLFQMEPATHDDIHLNFLAFKPDIQRRLHSIEAVCTPDALVGNLWYAAAMTRIHYFRVPDALPDKGDIEAQAHYWKVHYNTLQGSGTEAEYLTKWERYVSD